MGPKWAKMLRSMAPWMAGLKLATWIVDIFYWCCCGAGAVLLLCAALTVTMIAFTGEETHANIAQSKTGVYVNKMVHAIRGVLPEDIAEPVNKHFETLHSIIENTAEQPEPTAEED